MGHYYWDTFAEVRHLFEDDLNRASAGETIRGDELEIPLLRYGLREMISINFIYMPLVDHSGRVTKVAVWVIENTQEVSSRKAIHELNEQLGAANEGLQAANEELTSTQTTLRQRNTDLVNSDTRFRTLVQEAPVAIFVLRGPEMMFEMVNNVMYRMLGKGAAIIGQPFAEAVPELAGQPFFEILSRVYATGETYYGSEVKGTVNVGGRPTTGYFNFIYQPVKDEQGAVTGIMCVATDVLEQVTARQHLEQAYEQIRLSKEAAELGTFDMDLLAGNLVWDKRCRELFGISHDDEVSYDHDFVKGLHPDDRERITAIINDVFIKDKTQGIYDVEYRTVGVDDQKLRWVRAKGQVYFDENKRPLRFIGSVLDITEQKQDEQRKNDFIGMVSHELKTPLTSLTSMLQVLEKKLQVHDDPFVKQAIGKSVLQTRRMSKMINGFLNVSRLESGKIQIEKERFEICALISEMIAEVQLMAQSHYFEQRSCTATRIEADRDKIGSVISNLLSNAVKYAPSGSRIMIDCFAINDSVQVSIADEGAGIPLADQEKIFDRYHRSESQVKKHISGFGIGLYLSAEIIKRHQGRIWVTSAPDSGAVFHFTLPLNLPDQGD